MTRQNHAPHISIFLFCLGVFFFLPLHAKTIYETEISDSLKCGSTNLPFQSAGLRTATFLNIRVYVVAIYAAKKTMTERPVCFEITYLRDVSDEDADKAWAYQFKESSEKVYPELDNHVKKLQDFFGDIKGARKHLFALLPNETQFWENGVLKGTIAGEDFQKNFLTIWFGKNPPTKEVQEQLLKGLK